jgi:hypothetical protein
MVQAIGRQPLMTAPCIQSKVSATCHLGFVVDSMTLSEVFLRLRRLYLVIIIPLRPHI